MKIFSYIILLFVIFFSCNNETIEVKRAPESGCNLNDPINELRWLKEIKEDLEKLNYCNIIQHCLYKDKNVIVISNCEPNINSISQYYYCSGEAVFPGNTNYPESVREFQEKATDWKTLWHSNN